MLQKLRSWFFSQPNSERRSLIIWVGALAGLVGVGAFAYIQLPEAMSVYYYLLGLVVVNSILFFSLYRQMPTMKVTMLTLIFVLELATLGYYILAGVAIQ